MRARLADDLLPRLGVQAQSDLVAHGAGRHKDGGFAPEDLRGACLQPVDRGVFAINVVPDVRRGHGGPHLRRWFRYGVAA